VDSIQATVTILDLDGILGRVFIFFLLNLIDTTVYSVSMLNLCEHQCAGRIKRVITM